MEVRETMQALKTAVTEGHLAQDLVDQFMDEIETAILAMFRRASNPDIKSSALVLDDLTSCWWQEGGR